MEEVESSNLSRSTKLFQALSVFTRCGNPAEFPHNSAFLNGTSDTFSEQPLLHSEHCLLTPVEAYDRVGGSHDGPGMPGLCLGLERRGALLLQQRQVLPPEGVPPEARKVQSQALGSRADHVPQNRAIVHRLAVLLKDVGIWSGARRLVPAVSVE